MTDRAEEILVAVATKLDGLTTTGANVVRDRVWPTSESVTASLSVEMGSENPSGEDNNAFQDEELEVIVAAQVKGAQGTISTKLNTIRSEVYVALMADHKLGLTYVTRIRWNGRGRPGIENMEKATGEQDMSFIVEYRHSQTNPGA